MENSNQHYKDLLRLIDIKKIKFPKIKLPTIDFSSMRKPPRWVVITIAFLIEVILLFFILWLFDERTVFKNDYLATNYRGEYMKWGWVHMGTTITAIIVAVIWFFIVLFGELAEYEKEDKIFYKLYR